ncbi:MAG: guanylate kinase [Bacteroidales bacterium]|nr:guanylate kinase [Bacteroidales bacterium]
MEGKIIIISAPSGCGKSTIINALMDRGDIDMQFSVSATNRKPREGERDGEHYHFLSTQQFKDAIANGDFVGYEEVYPGRYYGTLKSEITHRTARGHNVILDIDVKGGANVKELYGDRALSIFIMPPSIDTLRERLESRGTETRAAIDQRVARAEYEISFAPKFDKTVVNDNLDEAIKQTGELISSFIKK